MRQSQKTGKSMLQLHPIITVFSLFFIHYTLFNTSYYLYVAQHRRLTDKLSDAQVELKTLQKRLKDAEQQVATMKQQLHKYVQEVKRAEDLLLQKVNLSMHILFLSSIRIVVLMPPGILCLKGKRAG